MRLSLSSVIVFATLALLRNTLAQDLAPRAYVITPTHSNAVTLTYAFYSGNLDLGNLPITDAAARASIPVVSFVHSMSFFSRSANFAVSLPYGVGNFRGSVLGTETNVYRSGLLDSVCRFSVNIRGGPAMTVQQYSGWRQKTIVGASLRIIAPTGQYDSTKLINWGNNRWALKPELGLSRRWGHWIVDGYAGAWFFTTNPAFFSNNQFHPGTFEQKQSAIVAFEGHLSYDVRPRLWASLDGNFWRGGRTSLNGVENPVTDLRNSRVGGTVSIPIGQHQSVKIGYNRGAYIRYGGDFQSVSLAWQYSWLSHPN
jgi:hypothetical protein